MFVLFCCCYDMIPFRATFIPLYLKFPSAVKLAWPLNRSESLSWQWYFPSSFFVVSKLYDLHRCSSTHASRQELSDSTSSSFITLPLSFRPSIALAKLTPFQVSCEIRLIQYTGEQTRVSNKARYMFSPEDFFAMIFSRCSISWINLFAGLCDICYGATYSVKWIKFPVGCLWGYAFVGDILAEITSSWCFQIPAFSKKKQNKNKNLKKSIAQGFHNL